MQEIAHVLPQKKGKRRMETVAVLDFETTGLSPDLGDRATEIAVILVRDSEVIDSFESLMNAGRHIPAYVSRLTGITNEMIAAAPSATKVMTEAARFFGRVAAKGMADELYDRGYWWSTALMARRTTSHSMPK